jgi:hypothetical protein
MTLGKQLVNFITCGCESSAPFFVIYKAGREPTPYSEADLEGACGACALFVYKQERIIRFQ